MPYTTLRYMAMKEISVEMPNRQSLRLRSIAGSIYHLILLREIMRRYSENCQRPFPCSAEDICRSTGFSDADLSRALPGIEPYVTCRRVGDEIMWSCNLEYARQMIRELSR